MTKIRRIVFWDPCTSPHKADFFAALAAAAPDIEVICCADSELADDRKALGWSIKPSEAFRTVISPAANVLDQLVREKLDETLHIFSGIRWVPTIVSALKLVRCNGAKFAIWHEPRVREGWKGQLRFIHSWLTESWLRKHTAFVLAIGRNGPPWFRSVGYAEECVLPFAYFIDPPKHVDIHHDNADLAKRPTQIGYVGRLVKMKGVFDLVAAVARLGSTARLRIVGAGPDGHALKASCNALNLEADFLGVLPISEVGGFMKSLDVLVLASTTKDGWGVVVSEALMCGTAVVATTCVGASSVLNDAIFGKCVPVESPDSIATAIRQLHSSGAFSAERRFQRATMARQCLSAQGGADHLLEIIQWRFSGKARPLPFYSAYSVT